MFDTRTFLLTRANAWIAKYPEHRDRIERGLAIALQGKVAPRGLDTFRVCGSRRGVEYLVEVNCGYPRCSCADFKGRKVRCKHIWSAALMTRLADEVEQQLSQTPEPPRSTPALPRTSLNQQLSAHCAQLHQRNAELVRQLPVAQVYPIRRGVA